MSRSPSGVREDTRGLASESVAADIVREPFEMSVALQVVKCTLAALKSTSPEMQQFAESVLCIATSSQGVNRPVSKDDFVSSLECLEKVLKHIVVDRSDPLRGLSNWELEQMKVKKEIEQQQSEGKSAMTDAVLDSMDSFFRCATTH